MRIGLFSDTYIPEINGVATSVHTLRLELIKHGHTVYVVTTKNEKVDEEDPFVLRFPGIELKSLYGYVLTSPFHFMAYNMIKDYDLDIIHVHTEFSLGIFARIVAKGQGIPLVSTYHTTYEDYTHYVNPINLQSVENLAKKAVSSISKLYADTSSEMIAPSEKTKEMLERYGIDKTISVVATGIDLDRFDCRHTSEEQRHQLRQKFFIKPEETLITYVGRIAQEKSIDFVIDGFKIIKEKGLNCKFLIVGGGPEVGALEEKRAMYGLEDIVIFAGKVPNTEVPIYYHSSDCFVSASLTETQGMTYIEAMASGLPVFARRDVILQELVIENKTGFYCDTPTDFADKVEYFLSLSQEEKNQLKNNSIELAKGYDSEIFYNKVMEVYERTIVNYTEMMEITSIVYKNDYVLCTLSSPNHQDVSCSLFIDTIYEKGYKKESKIPLHELEELMSQSRIVTSYIQAIRKISLKDRTRQEMYDWATQKTELSIEEINMVIERLEERGYIDDLRYAQSSVFTMKLKLDGKHKIIRHLKNKGIPIEIIEEVIKEDESDDEIKNATLWISKLVPTIKDKSIKMKKQLIRKKAYIQGYAESVIDEVLSTFSFVDDENLEIDRCRKEAHQAVKRYNKKLNGMKLRNAIYRYLTSVGFNHDDIVCVLDEMEWDNEQEN